MDVCIEGDALSPDKLTKLARVYIRIREKRSELKKEFDDEYSNLSKKMDEVASALDKHCVSNGVKSVKTEGGDSFYRRVTTRYFSNDWKIFVKYALDNDVPDLIQQRISTKNLKEYLDQNEGEVIPTLQADSTYSISVRKGSNK